MADQSSFPKILTFILCLAALSYASSIGSQQVAGDDYKCGSISTSSKDLLELKEGVTLPRDQFEKVRTMKLKGAGFWPNTKRSCAIKICGFTSFANRPPQVTNSSLIGSENDYADCQIYSKFNIKASPIIYNDLFNSSSVSCGCNKGIDTCRLNCFERQINWKENECAILYQESYCRNCYFNQISIPENGGFTTDNGHHFHSAIVRENCELTQDITGLNRIWRFENVSKIFHYNSTRSPYNIMSAYLYDPEVFHCSCKRNTPTFPQNPNLLILVFVLGGVASFLSVALLMSLLCMWINFMKNKDKDCEGIGVDHSQRNCIPLDSFLIPESNFKLYPSIILGQGGFGIVIKGDLQTAVKSVRPDSQHDAIASLQEEIKTMRRLAPHENVLRFYGVCNLNNGQLGIILEFCEKGSLLLYLKNEMKPKLEVTMNLLLQETQSDHRRENGTDRQPLLETSNTEQESMVFPPNVLHQFLQWCVEIANGMVYLISQKIAHLDLAARNIMLSCNLVAKISDFGASRPMYLSLYARSKTPNLSVPIHWVAPEVLEENECTSKSDVWSFGVTAWEIFTMGQSPYGNTDLTLEQLRNGRRLALPQSAPEDVSTMISKCFNLDPKMRPSFPQLRDFFESTRCLVMPHVIAAVAEQAPEAAVEEQAPGAARPYILHDRLPRM